MNDSGGELRLVVVLSRPSSATWGIREEAALSLTH